MKGKGNRRGSFLAGLSAGSFRWRTSARRCCRGTRAPRLSRSFICRSNPFFRQGCSHPVAQPWPHYQSKYFIVEPSVTRRRARKPNGNTGMLGWGGIDAKKASNKARVPFSCLPISVPQTPSPTPAAAPRRPASPWATEPTTTGERIKRISFHWLSRFTFQLACFISTALPRPSSLVHPSARRYSEVRRSALKIR